VIETAQRLSTFLLLCLLYSSVGHGQDLFHRTQPNTFAFLEKVQGTQSVGGYPILNLGNDLGLVRLSTTYSTGQNDASGIPLGSLYAVDIRNGKFFAAVTVQANLSVVRNVSDWTDEPCKREDFLWKKSIGGTVNNINCATINHVVNFFVRPTGEFQQYLVYFKDKGIEIPPTVVRATFSRITDRGRRLVYTVSVNPELFGVERDSEPQWGSNSWHKAFIQRDAKKVEFVSNFSNWAEDVQSRMAKAFDKQPGAFSGLPEFVSYFKQAPSAQPGTSSMEEKLRVVKDLFEKKLITEQQYNEQVKDILSGR
jgi:hypothetical protein